MAAEHGPTPEDVEEGRKAAYSSGLQAVKFALEDLAAEFQRSDDRPALAARALAIEPLLSVGLGMEFVAPTSTGPRQVFLRFARVGADYEVAAEQEKVAALCADLSELQRADVRKGVAGQMSLLIYNARAAFRMFATLGGGAEFLCDLLGDCDSSTRERILAGAFTIDADEMTLRVVEDGPRYGMVIDVEKK